MNSKTHSNSSTENIIHIKKIEKINCLGANVWSIIDLSTETERKIHFDDLNEKDLIWVQNILLCSFPFQDARGTLRYAVNTIKAQTGALKALIKIVNKKKSLASWKIFDVTEAIRERSILNGNIQSSATIRQFIKAINSSYELRYIQDGISFELPDSYLAKVMTPICASFETTLSQWERPINDMLPMSVGTILLSDAIKTIRSTNCKMLQTYFKAYRYGVISRAYFKSGSVKSVLKCDLESFTTIGNFQGEENIAKNDRRIKFVQTLKEIDPTISDFPFKSFKDITEAVKHVEGACLVLLLAVTGMRISECHSINSDWIESIRYLDINNEWTEDAIFKSKIIKTSGGIVAKRGLSFIGIEVFNVLNALSWVDKEELGLQLFAPTFIGPWTDSVILPSTQKTVSKCTLRKKLQAYYKKFLLRCQKSVSESFNHLNPHDLRHFKMAFALRKFDGNVEEAIKQEFRHHNHHTQAYSINKLNSLEAEQVKNEYIIEIVRRILINDPNDRWVGPTVKKVRSLALKLLDGRNIEFLSIKDLAEFHQDMQSHVHAMTFHSYGICFVLDSGVNVAKCGVKDNIVRTGDANSKDCHGCSNFGVNSKSHETNMRLNKARWKATANCQTISNFPIVNKAREIVRSIEKLEAELESL